MSVGSGVKRVIRTVSGRDARRAAAVFASATSGVRGSEAFDGLSAYSLAVASSRVTGGQLPAVNLVLPELAQSAIFAGIRTAIEVGVGLATRAGRPLRVIFLHGKLGQKDRAAVEAMIRRDFSAGDALPISFIAATELPFANMGETDLWIATHWITAHSLDVAARLGNVNPEMSFTWCRTMNLVFTLGPPSTRSRAPHTMRDSSRL